MDDHLYRSRPDAAGPSGSRPRRRTHRPGAPAGRIGAARCHRHGEDHGLRRTCDPGCPRNSADPSHATSRHSGFGGPRFPEVRWCAPGRHGGRRNPASAGRRPTRNVHENQRTRCVDRPACHVGRHPAVPTEQANRNEAGRHAAGRNRPACPGPGPCRWSRRGAERGDHPGRPHAGLPEGRPTVGDGPRHSWNADPASRRSGSRRDSGRLGRRLGPDLDRDHASCRGNRRTCSLAVPDRHLQGHDLTLSGWVSGGCYRQTALLNRTRDLLLTKNDLPR
ncbi:hypothetical protein UA75_22045 [Actinoalloteichus sp. GBA129-24]|uniref:Uncharacterized protein n=1 Tax=Actinoalloteichus fjordicus TaxID=1612552 RepID=A0AAC9PT64_9PSEU|nr:hypothetical protein UA74_21570 [Actinoalloteichus fjordicus]APU22398.1 hypothetical protein UA75_22045 [Actinoalloteichus sp. GBA129-24]